MRTYDRNGVHIEQCDQCRGLFLDLGEFESLSRLENQLAAPPQFTQQPGYSQQQYPQHQQGYGPGWGTYGGKHYRKKGLSGLFFSS